MNRLTTFVIAGSKLTAYLLDIDHPDGGSKAKFFLARGFSRQRPEELAQALNIHVASDAAMRQESQAPDGRPERRMIAVGPLACPDGTTPLVKSVWQFDDDSEVARLVTAYPARAPAGPEG